jgi:hypothetical protein
MMVYFTPVHVRIVTFINYERAVRKILAALLGYRYGETV